jgi:hypothetical protein
MGPASPLVPPLSAAVFPSATSVKVPKKLPPSSSTIANNAEHHEFIETAASTLILAYTGGGMIQQGGHAP